MPPHLAKMLIISGLALVLLGVLFLAKPHLPWLGHLPGDIAIEKENMRFYFPLTTCLLISALVSVVMWFLRK